MDRYNRLINQIEMQCALGAKELSRHIAAIERNSRLSRTLRKSKIRY